MKGNLIDLIPPSVMIEIEDIGHLFFRYFRQSQIATPHQVAKDWLGRMNDVCNEEWGSDLLLSVDLTPVPTCDLLRELKEREGVRVYPVPNPDWEYEIKTYREGHYKTGTTRIEGPATILEVTD